MSAHVLNKERDAIRGGGDAGVELEELEDLRLEVDFGAEVGDFEVDFTDADGGVEVDVWFGDCGGYVGGGGGGVVD